MKTDTNRVNLRLPEEQNFPHKIILKHISKFLMSRIYEEFLHIYMRKTDNLIEK